MAGLVLVGCARGLGDFGDGLMWWSSALLWFVCGFVLWLLTAGWAAYAGIAVMALGVGIAWWRGVVALGGVE